MSKREKHLAKAKNNPQGLSFDDFCILSIQSGWKLDHQTGSHLIWYSPSGYRLSIQNRNGIAMDRLKNTKLNNSYYNMRQKMLHNNPFDGYTIRLYFDEDGDWLAHLIELPNVSAFAATPEQAVQELLVAWEGVKESYRKHNEIAPIANYVAINKTYAIASNTCNV